LEHAVDDQMLIANPKLSQLAAGSSGFAQRTGFGASDQDERRHAGSLSALTDSLIQLLLSLQSGQWVRGNWCRWCSAP
jgi:hypothetical protein